MPRPPADEAAQREWDETIPPSPRTHTDLWERGPTLCEIREKAVYELEDDTVAAAMWHPQLGGYVGRCWVRTARSADGCFDVYLCHDGEFPTGSIVHQVLHYCAVEQLVEFAQNIKNLQQIGGEECP